MVQRSLDNLPTWEIRPGVLKHLNPWAPSDIPDLTVGEIPKL
jgi:hypothetical protein